MNDLNNTPFQRRKKTETIKDIVKTVNGVIPDANGNIVFNGGDAVNVGDITQLPTADKTNIVNALKEQNTKLAGKANQSDLNTISTNLTAKADKIHTHTELHTHLNKIQLDKLGEDSQGKLTYNGSLITWSNTDGTTINDASTTSTTETWSSNKINVEIGKKSNTSHIHSISDVTNLQTSLDNKSIIGHKHTLLDLSDVDVSNKANGNVITYDSASSKFKSLPLPSGSGSGATNLDGLTDVDISTTTPLEGDILTFKSGMWKSGTAPVISSGTTYTIELSRWGITLGIPNKPYVDAHYNAADANIQGINNAIVWAYNNGFRYIIMPKGDYALCYPREIVIKQKNLTFDLNGSTFKVIYDSDSKSPFDPRVGANDYYAYPSASLPGISFNLEAAYNSHIINGKIIGCKADRSFSNPKEREQEWTVGIQLSKSTSFCSVRNCDISHYMADAIAFENSAFGEYAEFGLGLTVNDLDKTTGAVIASTNTTLISDFIPIPTNTTYPSYNSFLITGFGFTRTTGLITKDFGVYFYRADNTFIGALHEKKIYAPVTIPPGATKYRFVFYNETVLNRTSTAMSIHLKFGLTPHHNIIERNEIYGCYRGGIQPGGNDNIIQDNIIHDIGTSFLDGKPIFYDPTRYAINQEDAYGDSTVIRNNLIYDCFTGILCGSYNALIENNRIYNCLYNAMGLYTMMKGVIRGNYIYKCGGNITLMGGHFSTTHVEISSNTFVGAGMNWGSGTEYRVNAHDNTFIDPTNNIDLFNEDIHSFKNNHFKFNKYHTTIVSIIVNRMDGCTFEYMGTGQKDITLVTKEMVCGVFNSMNLRMNTRNQTSKREKIKIRDCKFNNSIVMNEVTGVKQKTIDIRESELKDSVLKVANLNVIGEYPTILVKNSDISTKTGTYLFESSINTSAGYGIIELEKCNIDISNADFLYFIKNGYTVVTKTSTLAIKKSNVNYSGTGKLALNYYSHKNTMVNFISAENRFYNITLPAPDIDKLITYDPDNFSESKPSSGYFFVGQTKDSAFPVSGGYKGWICLTSGEACEAQWSTNLPVTTGYRIYNGTLVYEALNDGKTSNNAPTFPTGVDSVIQDKNGMTPWVSSTNFTVGALIVPSVSNNFYYECTTSGTSGATEPSWTASSGSTTSDGNVVWTARKIVTWKNIGTKAILNPYGLIS
ncbi:right-handed parallel beta-helix repeat-containing protein [Peribacillus simplex]|uniref:right-handed parallel beta-helix repeat-containing protein n=1 Tax=Peribacillus simplex TaxID=1478 RepID=UPI002E24211E|nr:right-handed parallel beta-helix repeat-containing protein [Peribacillus simplex]